MAYKDRKRARNEFSWLIMSKKVGVHEKAYREKTRDNQSVDLVVTTNRRKYTVLAHYWPFSTIL